MLTFTWEDTYDIYIYGITSELIRAEQMLLINFIVGLIYAKKARVYAPSAIKVALFVVTSVRAFQSSRACTYYYIVINFNDPAVSLHVHRKSYLALATNADPQRRIVTS